MHTRRTDGDISSNDPRQPNGRRKDVTNICDIVHIRSTVPTIRVEMLKKSKRGFPESSARCERNDYIWKKLSNRKRRRSEK